MTRRNATLILFLLAFSLPSAFARGGIGSPGTSTSISPATASPSPAYRRMAALGVAALQGWYVPGTGQYADPAGWWHTANAITMLANYERITGDRSYDSVLANTFAMSQKNHPNFLNMYYDDEGWWALTWIDAYDLTSKPAYLSMAETIFHNIATKGWDNTVCGGGVWWSTQRSYKNAIPNELFLTIAAKLANRTKGRASAAYLAWAQKEWAWFKASGMINAQNLVNDGLTSSNPSACTNNHGITWTYNQGVILGGLAELYAADKDASLLVQAQAIANAAIAGLSTHGVLIEPRVLKGGDAPQFKGIFMRNLADLYKALPGAQSAAYKTFAQSNADSIWKNDQASGHRFGGLWQGPVDSVDATRQSSALDALVAAAAMQ